MNIYITDGFYVSKQFEEFAVPLLEEGKDLTVILTDGKNPLFLQRESQFLHTLNGRDLSFNVVDSFEDEDIFKEELVKVIKGTLRPDKDTIHNLESIHFESKFPSDISNDIITHLKDTFNDIPITKVKGFQGLLVDLGEDLVNYASTRWYARFSDTFFNIINSRVKDNTKEIMDFVIVTNDVNDDGLVLGVGYDFHKGDFFLPEAHIENVWEIPMFVDIIEDNFGIEVVDYIVRSTLLHGETRRVVFLIVRDYLNTVPYKGNIELDDASYILPVSLHNADRSGIIPSWISTVVERTKIYNEDGSEGGNLFEKALEKK